ncbi:unnamed protein product [Adineta steineri]|uniref:Uncharacterized protein n=1 Tax=Adineta steineri TaxID=433720 RepID=A0A816AVT2_9BILA|nr:unnamed protein product [Adineta steineri]CAF1599868.1 unnamed protein product [Adineta steineri]
MVILKILFYFILLRSIVTQPNINLYHTDWVNNDKNDIVFPHDCLHVISSFKKETDPYQVVSYCLNELPSKWIIQENTIDQKFTFAELYQQNITSQQLYLWSAPIDVIEQYQLYLNERLSTGEFQYFYNCTLPRFGPQCQYSLDIYQSYNLSLNEMISDFYQQEYDPINLTCYIHLECNRGSKSACLDWSEICDGTVDCLNDGIDEKNCWQLEINQCEENEYRCHNGQCISRIFHHDNPNTYECLDRSDENQDTTTPYRWPSTEPIFTNEDIICPLRFYLFIIRFTSSCIPKRNNLLKDMLFLDTPNLLSDICWLAFKCHYGIPNSFDPKCNHICVNKTCKQIINETCPDLLIIPTGALAFGHIYFAYQKEIIVNSISSLYPQYICYNDQLCNGFYSNRTLFIINNSTCRRPQDFPITFQQGGRFSLIDQLVKPLYTHLYQCNTIIYNNFSACDDSSTMYRCMNSSKCISRQRLCDGKNDCSYKDDENCPLINETCSTLTSETLFKCTAKDKCISSQLVRDGKCDCGIDDYGLCPDEDIDDYSIRKYISFPIICDGFTELEPIMIDGKNETDETECEYWQCNNTYTRCDGFWNCLNGADEVDCDSSPLLNCPSLHHPCISFDTHQLTCLPIKQANDGHIDCVGATDEPKLCRSNNFLPTYTNFYCKQNFTNSCISISSICNDYHEQCSHKNDFLCVQIPNSNERDSICNGNYESRHTNAQKFLCKYSEVLQKPSVTYFSIDKIKPSSQQLSIQQKKIRSSFDSSISQYNQRCHRGLPLRVWLNNNKNLTVTACLCPPSFYGHLCQYQNQRISLTVQFQTFSHSRQTLFAIIILLIDDSDERIIHSSQQLTYLSAQHCQRKFNLYLLYSQRPKNQTKQYSIHIDIYRKNSFTYRGSLLIPLNYPFLPVHRISVQLNIPRIDENRQDCIDHRCVHGQCMRYSDGSKGNSFCRCNHGWSGKYCTISYTCMCSSDSLCVGVLPNNRSICVCPLNRWGSRCLLSDIVCQSERTSPCNNSGQCVATDEQMISDKKFVCICPKGFSGERCEIADSKIIVTFHKDMILPSSILIHFIQVMNNSVPENGSTFKNIPINHKSIIIRWSRPFHIAFTELSDNNYYLITVQKTYHPSAIISTTINPSDRCKHINELFNETIVKLHLLRRIKYYHVPCQRQHSPALLCFYDDSHFCLCNDYGKERVANCFEFNASIEHNCFGQSNCENGAQCLQDKYICPQTSICICPKCFYGKRCQFSSNLFGLALDGILGYHIQPYINMKHQPHIVQVSAALTMIVIIVGFINGFLMFITFKNKELRKTGSGLYLLTSSMTTLCTVIIFALKFWILIIAQITYMTSRSFLYFQCMSFDFLLRINLNMDQWLTACVSLERAITTIKGPHFDKQKSKQSAKYIILFLFIILTMTTIHDPIHRHLLDDIDYDDEKRIWCIITYSSSLHIYDLLINSFHFFIPFLINFISAIIIIKKTAQYRTRSQNNKHFLMQLRKQLRRYNHLLIAPFVLVILALPRLIISFASGCMKSGQDSWLFLTGYFISFIPSTITFMVFVLPSKIYRQEFMKSIKKYQLNIKRRIHPIF